jgi:hypothetical protein
MRAAVGAAAAQRMQGWVYHDNLQVPLRVRLQRWRSGARTGAAAPGKRVMHIQVTENATCQIQLPSARCAVGTHTSNWKANSDKCLKALYYKMCNQRRSTRSLAGAI